jgi:hypothetical protein
MLQGRTHTNRFSLGDHKDLPTRTPSPALLPSLQQNSVHTSAPSGRGHPLQCNLVLTLCHRLNAVRGLPLNGVLQVFLEMNFMRSPPVAGRYRTEQTVWEVG